MEKIVLNAEKREGVGKEAAKKLRQQKKIPAVVYGTHVKPVSLIVAMKDFMSVLHNRAGSNVLIDLKVPGVKEADQTVIIKEVQHHPVTNAVYHIDFQAISLTEKIRVKVQVRETGESPGVAKGGILDKVHHELEVECLPTEIPQRIDVDISGLDFGHGIHVSDLKLPDGVVCTLDQGEVVFTVKAPREEEAAPEQTAGEAVEPELIKKGKEEVEEEGAAEKAEKAPAKGEKVPAKGAAEKAEKAPGKGTAEKAPAKGEKSEGQAGQKK